MILKSFSLLRTGKGWQLNMLFEGSEGWSVKFIDNNEAEELLACVEKQVPAYIRKKQEEVIALTRTKQHAPKPKRERLRLDE